MVNEASTVTGSDIIDAIKPTGQGVAPAVRHSKELQYWKMCSDPSCLNHQSRKGWVTCGPVMSRTTVSERYDFETIKHATPLSVDYGVQVVGSDWLGPRRFDRLISNGGIVEFPVDQMVAYGWHRYPIIVQARPDLEGVVDIYCEHGCAKVGPGARVFTEESDYLKHVRVLHKEAAAPEAIGRAVGGFSKQDLAEVLASNKLDMEQLALVIATTLKSVQKGEG